jgi:hypothetical protein
MGAGHRQKRRCPFFFGHASTEFIGNRIRILPGAFKARQTDRRTHQVVAVLFFCAFRLRGHPLLA